MKAQLILENGKRFCGELFGAEKEACGEVIFTTGMVGYQEVITNPSYTGQMVVMTFPLIGNYGINYEDMESDKINLSALIVREKCDCPSNFRSKMTLDEFLKKNNTVGLCGIDTRALTKELRDNGTMKGIIVTRDIADVEINEIFSSIDNSDVIKKTSTDKTYVLNENGEKSVAFIDMGSKNQILNKLLELNFKVTVFPADTSYESISETNPDFVFISDGPGNPQDLVKTVDTVKKLIDKYPVYGISLGHQIIGLALGCNVKKLKYGHHGANHPVKDLLNGGVYITAQNHNFVLCDIPQDVLVTFENVNDGTCAGIKHITLSVESFQFLPEINSQKPIDISCLFDKFLKGDE